MQRQSESRKSWRPLARARLHAAFPHPYQLGAALKWGETAPTCVGGRDPTGATNGLHPSPEGVRPLPPSFLKGRVPASHYRVLKLRRSI